MKILTTFMALSIVTVMTLTAFAIVSADKPVTRETLDVIKATELRQNDKPHVLEEVTEKPATTDEEIPAELVTIDEKVVEEVMTAEKPYVPTYSDDDLFCLACVIYAEAGADYCSDELRMAVGNVVLNRVASNLYPDSIRKVIEQPMQYGWLSRDGVYFPANAVQYAIDRAYDCAKRLLDGERPLPADVIFQAEFAQGDEIYRMIDGVYFCRYIA